MIKSILSSDALIMKPNFLIWFLVQLACSLGYNDELYLSKVDNLIVDRLTNPLPGEGDLVLDTLQIYVQELNNTIEAFKYNRTGQEAVDHLIQAKGPKCIAPFINDHTLESHYEWGVKELGELYWMLGNIKMLWRDFRYFLVNDLGYDIDPLPPFFTTTVNYTVF